MAVVSREQPHRVVHDRACRRQGGAENRVARLGLARNTGAAAERQRSALRSDGPSRLRRWTGSDGRVVRSRRAHDARSARRDRGVTIWTTSVDNGAAEIAVSATGTLAFIEPGTQPRAFDVTHLGRPRGARGTTAATARSIQLPAQSPRTAHGSRWTSELWTTATFGSGTCAARLWLGSRMDRAEDMLALWTPDSRRVFFASDRAGNIDVYSQPADGRRRPESSSRLRTRSSRTPSLPTLPPSLSARTSTTLASSISGDPRPSLC